MAEISLEKWQNIREVIPVEEFRAFFKNYSHSAFRLETLPSYAVAHEDEHYKAFLSGAKTPPFIYQDWKQTIQDATSAGKSFDIVRVVPDPLTTYFRYELEWHYLEYRSAGQNTQFLLPHNISESLSAAVNKDFWLFDDSVAIVMIYNEQGNIDKRCRITDDKLLGLMKQWKDLALKESVSMDQYLEIYNNL